MTIREQIKAPFEMSGSAVVDGVSMFQANRWAFRCPMPRCTGIRTKKRDEIILGFHQITCPVCGHSTHRVKDVETGELYERGDEAHR